MFRLKVTGANKIARSLARRSQRADRELDRQLDIHSADMLARSEALVPVFRGDLAETGQVISSKDARIISYGTDHAVFAHEVVSASGQLGLVAGGSLRFGVGPITAQKPATADGPAGGKFLARPFNRSRRKIDRQILKAVRRAAEKK